MAVISGPVIQIKSEQREGSLMERRRVLFIDGLSTLLIYGLGLMVVIYLWEYTSLLNENLSPCTSNLVGENVSIICLMTIGLGVLNCAFSYIFRYLEEWWLSKELKPEGNQ